MLVVWWLMAISIARGIAQSDLFSINRKASSIAATPNAFLKSINQYAVYWIGDITKSKAAKKPIRLPQ